MIQDGTVTSKTFSGLADGTEYEFNLRASNRAIDGYGEWSSSVVATTTDPPDPPDPSTNRPPVIAEVSANDVTERTGREAGVYQGSDPDNDPFEWFLEGDDRDDFQLEDVPNQPKQKALHFRVSPDYETRNSYSVILKIKETNRTESERLSGTRSRTVAVVNGPDPGYLSFSPNPPQACNRVTVTLRDQDGGLTMNQANQPQGVTYGFEYSPHSPISRESEREPGSAASTSLSEFQTFGGNYANKKVSVRARYGDNFRNRNIADGLSGIVTADVPNTPRDFSGTPAVREIALSWTAPDHCGEGIDNYHYQYRVRGTSGWTRGTTTSTGVTLTGLAHATQYDLEVKAENDNGFGSSASTSATTPPRPHVNRPPVLDDYSATVAEGPNRTVGTYTATDPDAGDAITSWTLDPASRSSFTLSPSDDMWSATLAFSMDPDHEARESYSVRITVADRAGATDTGTIRITVSNVIEPGRITLSPNPPRTCAHVEATLTDADGGINTEFSDSPPGFPYGWRWIPQSSRPPSATTTTQSYLPGNSLVGQTIRVTVQYGDNASNRNTAARTSGAVQANALFGRADGPCLGSGGLVPETPMDSEHDSQRSPAEVNHLFRDNA